MDSMWFLKLALKCIDHFAWPLLALGYPLCASVQAIETDSYRETRNLISYWIVLSLICLFEYAFMRLLQWFLLWPYIKLLIIFCLIIPDFGRASYIYNKFIRSCISMKPQTVICRLKNWRKYFVQKENFLLHAERYIKENGTEALEKLIASKNTMSKPDAEATNSMRDTDSKDMQQNTTYKPDAEATNAIRTTDSKEMKQYLLKEHRVQTNGKGLQTQHKDIKDLEIIEKKEIPAGKQDIPVVPNLVPSQNTLSAMVETKGIVGKDTASGGELPQSSTHKEVQKEWTCALCQFTTTSEKTLNIHLQGKKHRATCEALKAKNQPTCVALKAKNQPISQKLQFYLPKEELKQKNIVNQLDSHSNTKTGESIVNNGLKGIVVMDQKKVQELQKNLAEPVRMNHSKLRCEICNLNITSESDMASHLNGRKHLANIQILQNDNKDIA